MDVVCFCVWDRVEILEKVDYALLCWVCWNKCKNVCEVFRSQECEYSKNNQKIKWDDEKGPMLSQIGLVECKLELRRSNERRSCLHALRPGGLANQGHGGEAKLLVKLSKWRPRQLKGNTTPRNYSPSIRQADAKPCTPLPRRSLLNTWNPILQLTCRL